MELTRILNSYAFKQWVAEACVVFFLVGGVVVLVIGLSLFFNSAATLRFFGSMNRWVSMRRTTKPLEIQRDTRQAVLKYRRWLAVVFIAGGLFALYGLVTQFDARAIIFGLKLQFLKTSFATWLFDSIRWVLIVGNLAAIAIGVALAFFPAVIDRLETRGSRWFSERQMTRGSDEMRTPLDQQVVAHPRASGLIMAFFGLVLIGAFGFMLAGMR